jgi:hypothetical protein
MFRAAGLGQNVLVTNRQSGRDIVANCAIRPFEGLSLRKKEKIPAKWGRGLFAYREKLA